MNSFQQMIFFFQAFRQPGGYHYLYLKKKKKETQFGGIWISVKTMTSNSFSSSLKMHVVEKKKWKPNSLSFHRWKHWLQKASRGRNEISSKKVGEKDRKYKSYILKCFQTITWQRNIYYKVWFLSDMNNWWFSYC